MRTNTARRLPASARAAATLRIAWYQDEIGHCFPTVRDWKRKSSSAASQYRGRSSTLFEQLATAGAPDAQVQRPIPFSLNFASAQITTASSSTTKSMVLTLGDSLRSVGSSSTSNRT